MGEWKARRRVYIWNTCGSLMNALSSLVLLMLINRMLDGVAGGVFSIGFACAQLVYSVSSYEMLTYQVTDKSRFSYGVYSFTKLALLLVAVLVGAGQLIWYGFIDEKAAVVMLLCLYKAVDGFDVLFMATLQKNERLDLYGLSLSLRILVSMLLFGAALFFLQSLLWAVAIFSVINILWVLTVDALLSQRYERFRVEWKLRPMIQLLWDCFPLFLYSLVIVYISNESKYLLEQLYNEELQNAYAIILMPAFAINLAGLFASRPLITTLSRHYEDDLPRFRKILLRLLLLLAGLTVACLVGGWFLGIPLLSAVYGVELAPYKTALMLIILGGGANAVIGLAYNIITIMRKQRLMLGAAVAVLLLLKLVGRPLVSGFGIDGSALVYLVGMAALAVLFVGIMLLGLKKKPAGLSR